MDLQYEHLITLNDFGFKKILDDFENTNTINILTYNISTKRNTLLNTLKTLENKTITIITNIPQRWERYFYDSARDKALIQIEEYLALLDPKEFKSNVEIYFNFKNHAKVYSTDNYTYIGSQNFSDESQNNYEAGVIITSNCGEELIENVKEESTRFFGIEIESFKRELQDDIEKIRKNINDFNYEIDFENISGINYLEEVKNNLITLTSLLEINIKQELYQIENKIKIFKESYYLEDIPFVENSLTELNTIIEATDIIIWEISKNGKFREVYFDYQLEAMNNVSWADEEHLDKALMSEMREMENICSDIKERYEEIIKNYFKNLDNNFKGIINLCKTIEKMTSNRGLINNTGMELPSGV